MVVFIVNCRANYRIDIKTKMNSSPFSIFVIDNNCLCQLYFKILVTNYLIVQDCLFNFIWLHWKLFRKKFNLNVNLFQSLTSSCKYEQETLQYTVWLVALFSFKSVFVRWIVGYDHHHRENVNMILVLKVEEDFVGAAWEDSADRRRPDWGFGYIYVMVWTSMSQADCTFI